MTIEFVIFGSVIFGIAAGLLLERMRARAEPAAAGGGALRLALPPAPDRVERRVLADASVPAWFDSAAQLRLVSDARFSSKRLLSDGEARVLEALEVIISDLGQDWRVMAQVNLAEIVASSDLAAISAIDDQRADLLIVSGDQMPVAVVEYQALGQIREDDAVRDAVKREALRRANIAYIEVRANDTPGSLRADIGRLVNLRSGPAPEIAEMTASPKPRKPRQPAARKPRRAAETQV